MGGRLNPNDHRKPVMTSIPFVGQKPETDRITVDGHRVGYMYRTKAHNKLDSGWAFLAGDESDAYLNNSCNHAIYDVNTIANYDPEIIHLLDALQGLSSFEPPLGSSRIRKALRPIET